MRGKKTDPEVIYKVMASWAVHHNKKEVERETGVPYTSVANIVKANKDKPEFVKLGEEKKEDFAKRAGEIIDKGMLLLTRRFDRALEHEQDLDALIGEIWATSREEISQEEKTKIVNKIRALQLQDVKALTTAIGTLFDKRALANGTPTENINIINGETLDKLAELAGYEKK